MNPTSVLTHIWLDDRGRAWIDDTNTKVVEILWDRVAHGSGPEEIRDQYPHLSLAQIHAAFAFYFDNKAAIDAEMAEELRQVDALRAIATGQVTREELIAKRERARTP